MLQISPQGSVHLRDFWLEIIDKLTCHKKTVVQKNSVLDVICKSKWLCPVTPCHNPFPHTKLSSLTFNSAKQRIQCVHDTRHHPFLFLTTAPPHPLSQQNTKYPQFLPAHCKTVEVKVWQHTKLTENHIQYLRIHSKPENLFRVRGRENKGFANRGSQNSRSRTNQPHKPRNSSTLPQPELTVDPRAKKHRIKYNTWPRAKRHIASCLISLQTSPNITESPISPPKGSTRPCWNCNKVITGTVCLEGRSMSPLLLGHSMSTWGHRQHPPEKEHSLLIF